MDSENEQLICKIEQMATYIHELETTLNNREDENEKLAAKMYQGFDMLDAVKIKQDELFHELENKNQELIRELDGLQCMFKSRSLCYQEEIDCLNGELETQKARSNEEMENMEKIHLDEIKTLQKQLSYATKKLYNSQQLLKSELKVKDQEIICIQNNLTEKIMKYAELEKKLSIEQDLNESLNSSLCELKIKYESDVCATRTEMTRLRMELKQNFAKLEESENQLQDAQCQIVKLTAEFEKTIKETNEGFCKEKKILEEKNDKLRTNIKSLVTSMEGINTKLSNSVMENKTLKCHLADQQESIKFLEATKNRLQQEMENLKENEELSAKMLRTEREQHAREQQICEKKLKFKVQDERELKELSKKLSERIKCLKKIIHENDMSKI
ncbi:flagellar attachment zone protein 1-like [Myzus persicae]|uniref:flagellar attachment zone protein 1-like n=1 Tax=Myzus persicae TaxID=13164 RepID=UPI000B9370F0|nr:flagellar attachment zone protein 1-like [Myzus persicae]